MSTVYLKDGTRATLVSKINDGFLVKRHLLCQKWNENSEDEEEFIEESDQVEIVQEVFQKAPIEFIDVEYRRILQKVEEQRTVLLDKQKELRQAEYDLQKAKSAKTDISRYIINREELRTAKRLILFIGNQIVPRILDGKTSHKFTVSYEISQYKGEERCWAYKLWSENRDNGWSGSDYFDEQYGIKVDLTDEEIKALALERLSKKKFSDIPESYLLSCPDEWLTPEWIKHKQERKERNERDELNRAEKELKAAQEKFDRLSKKELTVS